MMRSTDIAVTLSPLE